MFQREIVRGDKRRRYSVRASDLFTAGGLLTYTESAAENKYTMEKEEEELENGVLGKDTSDRVWKRSNLVHSKSGACAWCALLGNMR